MSERREFLETLALGGVALAVGACATTSSANEAPLPAAPPAAEDGPWDNYFNVRSDAFGTTYPLAQERSCAYVYAGA